MAGIEEVGVEGEVLLVEVAEEVEEGQEEDEVVVQRVERRPSS